MTEQSAATTTESDAADILSRSQTVFMVTALVLSVVSFMLNATMLSPAIRDINTHLGRRRIRADFELLLSRRRDRQRGADPVERLPRSQAHSDRRPDPVVHRNAVVRRQHLAAGGGGGPDHAGRLQHQLRPVLPDHAGTPDPGSVRRLLRGDLGGQRWGGRHRRAARRIPGRPFRLSLDLRADPGDRRHRGRVCLESLAR